MPKGHGAQAPSEEAFAPALAVPVGQGVQREGAEALKKVPEEHEGPPPPELVQEVEPSLSVKKLVGQATHVEEEVARKVVLKVLRGQGVGAPEPAAQKEPAGQATFEQEVAPVAGE